MFNTDGLGTALAILGLLIVFFGGTIGWMIGEVLDRDDGDVVFDRCIYMGELTTFPDELPMRHATMCERDGEQMIVLSEGEWHG